MTFVELQPVLDKLDAADKRRAAAFLIQQLCSGGTDTSLPKTHRFRVTDEDDSSTYAAATTRLRRAM